MRDSEVMEGRRSFQHFAGQAFRNVESKKKAKKSVQ